MPRSYDDKLVLCPFFIKQDATRIHCEGWSEVYRTTAITAFASADDKRAFAHDNCNSEWSRCPMCRLAAMKYR